MNNERNIIKSICLF